MPGACISFHGFAILLDSLSRTALDMYVLGIITTPWPGRWPCAFPIRRFWSNQTPCNCLPAPTSDINSPARRRVPRAPLAHWGLGDHPAAPSLDCRLLRPDRPSRTLASHREATYSAPTAASRAVMVHSVAEPCILVHRPCLMLRPWPSNHHVICLGSAHPL